MTIFKKKLFQNLCLIIFSLCLTSTFEALAAENPITVSPNIAATISASTYPILKVLPPQLQIALPDIKQAPVIKAATTTKATAPAPKQNSYSKYLVKRGDTLYLVARKFKTTITVIKNYNHLKSSNLYPGQALKIPLKSSVQPAPKPVQAQIQQQSHASRSQLNQSEILLLARLVYAESRGETYNGQVAVAATVLNRVASKIFPNTLAGVIYQKNEFSPVLDGQINLTPDKTAMRAVEDALKGIDPSNGALYYWNPIKAPNNKFLNSLKITARIGNHVFAK